MGQVIYRIHNIDLGAWWFSSGAKTRFDLGGHKNLGTCYVAAEAAGCFLEVFHNFKVVPEPEILLRRLSVLKLPVSFRLADCTAERCRGFGVTGEIHASKDYDLTQGWARALADAGFDGICHWLRTDPGKSQVGYALFHKSGDPEWKTPPSSLIPDTLLAEVEERYGIRVWRT